MPPARRTAPTPMATQVVGNRRGGDSPTSGRAEVGESSSFGSVARVGEWEDFGCDGGGGARLIDPDSAKVEWQALDVPIEGHAGNQVLNPNGVQPILRPQQGILLRQ